MRAAGVVVLPLGHLPEREVLHPWIGPVLWRGVPLYCVAQCADRQSPRRWVSAVEAAQ